MRPSLALAQRPIVKLCSPCLAGYLHGGDSLQLIDRAPRRATTRCTFVFDRHAAPMNRTGMGADESQSGLLGLARIREGVLALRDSRLERLRTVERKRSREVTSCLYRRVLEVRSSHLHGCDPFRRAASWRLAASHVLEPLLLTLAPFDLAPLLPGRGFSIRFRRFRRHRAQASAPFVLRSSGRET